MEDAIVQFTNRRFDDRDVAFPVWNSVHARILHGLTCWLLLWVAYILVNTRHQTAEITPLIPRLRFFFQYSQRFFNAVEERRMIFRISERLPKLSWTFFRRNIDMYFDLAWMRAACVIDRKVSCARSGCSKNNNKIVHGHNSTGANWQAQLNLDRETVSNFPRIIFETRHPGAPVNPDVFRVVPSIDRRRARHDHGHIDRDRSILYSSRITCTPCFTTRCFCTSMQTEIGELRCSYIASYHKVALLDKS